jgi:quercetin dioxygenase-like cupin family protein
VVAPDADFVADDLHVGMAVAEMPGEPDQRQRRWSGNLGKRLGLPGHQHHGTVIEHDAVAVTQRHRLVEVQQERGALLACERDAAATPVAGVEHDAVDGARGIPDSSAADGEAALHGCATVTPTDNGRDDFMEPIMTQPSTPKGKHSPPGQGNVYAKANEVIVKITGDDTAGTFEVVEENCKPGFQSRAHYHIKAYETFYVFDGSADFQVGDELYHGVKGSCVHIPPGVVHQVTSKEGVRMLMVYSPAGTDGMFAAMHKLTQEQIMDAELTKRIALEHDTVMVEQAKDGKGKGTILG